MKSLMNPNIAPFLSKVFRVVLVPFDRFHIVAVCEKGIKFDTLKTLIMEILYSLLR